jgi:hypothetical protein
LQPIASVEDRAEAAAMGIGRLQVAVTHGCLFDVDEFVEAEEYLREVGDGGE